MSSDEADSNRIDRLNLVATEIDPASGVVTYEQWLDPKSEKPHRDGAPALIERDADSGRVISEEWYDGGLRHNGDGAALTLFDRSTGNKILEEYWSSGRKHRLNEPAVIKYDPVTGAAIDREWWHFGQRIQKPAAGAVRQGPS